MVECECSNKQSIRRIKRVLIDTWWNVNEIAIKVFNDSDVGFNRYMVECEYVLVIKENLLSEGF